MGLDNGIYIISKKKINVPPWLASIKETNWGMDDYPYVYEIAYWRKCYNVRSAILNCTSHYDGSGGDIELDNDELNNFIKEYKSLLSEDDWNNSGDIGGSIWEWDEIKEHLMDNYKNLDWLKDWYVKNKDYKVIAVDSY